MRKLVIEQAALRHNMAQIQKRAAGALLYGSLMSHGGGAGIVDMARAFQAVGICHFAVHTVEEVRTLRRAGFQQEEILMLHSTVEREELEELIDLNAICTISSVDTGLALNAVAEHRAAIAEAHIQVNAGLGFGGFLVEEPEKILLAYRSLSNVALSGIYTQLHTLPQREGEVAQQLTQFSHILKTIHAAGYETGRVHATGSDALLSCPEAHLDAVMVGSILLGRCGRLSGDHLCTVGFGEAPLSDIRWLPKGHTIGGCRPVRLKQPTRVAILPVGYLHGFGAVRPPQDSMMALWSLWRQRARFFIYIRQNRVPVLGSIGATETIVDVTHIPCQAGDMASFDLDPLYARDFQIEYR